MKSQIPNEIENILSYKKIKAEWEQTNKSALAAKMLTLSQVEEFEKIISDDGSWKNLLEVFNNGREIDAWLAMDWPDGFDELVLCLPLCKLVDFECSNCIVGKKQENNSCAHDDSLFGYIAELLKVPDREGLINHIDSIKKVLLLEDFKWDILEKKLKIKN